MWSEPIPHSIANGLQAASSHSPSGPVQLSGSVAPRVDMLAAGFAQAQLEAPAGLVGMVGDRMGAGQGANQSASGHLACPTDSGGTQVCGHKK